MFISTVLNKEKAEHHNRQSETKYILVENDSASFTVVLLNIVMPKAIAKVCAIL